MSTAKGGSGAASKLIALAAIIGWATVSIAGVAPLDDPAVAQARGREQLEALVAPLLQGSGVWRAPNREHVSGDAKTAAFWRLEHEWVFERTLMRYRILGEFEDGHNSTYWEGSVAWDPRFEFAQVIQIHRTGIYGTGDLRRLGPDQVRFQMTFWRPGGGSEIFRDDMRWTGAGTMETRSQTYDPQEWKWIEKQVEHWELVSVEPAAAGGD